MTPTRQITCPREIPLFRSTNSQGEECSVSDDFDNIENCFQMLLSGNQPRMDWYFLHMDFSNVGIESHRHYPPEHSQAGVGRCKIGALADWDDIFPPGDLHAIHPLWPTFLSSTMRKSINWGKMMFVCSTAATSDPSLPLVHPCLPSSKPSPLIYYHSISFVTAMTKKHIMGSKPNNAISIFPSSIVNPGRAQNT